MAAYHVVNDIVRKIRFKGIRRGVVDDRISTQVFHQFCITSTTHRGDMSAHVLGQLDGIGSYSTGGANDKQLLAGLDLGTVAQSLQCGNADQRVSVRNFVCELIYTNQGTRSLVCERPW